MPRLHPTLAQSPRLDLAPLGWYSSGELSGGLHSTLANAVEGIGGIPYRVPWWCTRNDGSDLVTGTGSLTCASKTCGHFDGFFNPIRRMGTATYFPNDNWRAEDALDMKSYSPGVDLQFANNFWATQPWNNAQMNTYHPIPSAVTFLSLAPPASPCLPSGTAEPASGAAPPAQRLLIECRHACIPACPHACHACLHACMPGSP